MMRSAMAGTRRRRVLEYSWEFHCVAARPTQNLSDAQDPGADTREQRKLIT